MNIDKFGHHVHKRLRLDQILGLHTNISEKALVKSSSGEYNLNSATLKGLKLPVAPDEAASKAYVDKLSHKFIRKEDLNTQLQIIRKDLHEYIKTNLISLYTHLKEEEEVKQKKQNEQTTNNKRNS